MRVCQEQGDSLQLRRTINHGQRPCRYATSLLNAPNASLELEISRKDPDPKRDAQDRRDSYDDHEGRLGFVEENEG